MMIMSAFLLIILIINFPIETISFSTIRQRNNYYGPRPSRCPRNLFHIKQLSALTFMNENKSIRNRSNRSNRSNSNSNNNNSNNSINNSINTLPTTATVSATTINNVVSNRKNTSDANSLTKLVVLIIPLSVILTLAMNTNNSEEYSFVSQPSTVIQSEQDSINGGAMGTPPSSLSSATITSIQQQRQRQQQESELNLVLESVESLGTTILDAAIPQDATTLLSVTLGESFAGVLGAIATWGVNLGLLSNSETNTNSITKTNTNTSRRRNVDNDLDIDIDIEGDLSSSNDTPTWWKGNFSVNNIGNQKQMYGNNGNDLDTSSRAAIESSNTGVDLLFTEAVAESDYFLTKAAATPLLGAVGMSGGMASALTVLLASVPYQFIKFSAKAKEQKIKEEMYFDALLEMEKRKKKNIFSSFLSVINDRGFSPPTSANIMMATSLSTTSTGNAATYNEKSSIEPGMDMDMDMGYRFDFVELFADVCKWLEYDVLMTVSFKINLQLQKMAFYYRHSQFLQHRSPPNLSFSSRA